MIHAFQKYNFYKIKAKIYLKKFKNIKVGKQKVDVILRYYLKEPLEVECHVHKIYSYFYQISLIFIIDSLLEINFLELYLFILYDILIFFN